MGHPPFGALVPPLVDQQGAGGGGLAQACRPVRCWGRALGRVKAKATMHGGHGCDGPGQASVGFRYASQAFLPRVPNGLVMPPHMVRPAWAVECARCDSRAAKRKTATTAKRTAGLGAGAAL